MSINIVEVTWKGKLKEAFPDPNAYSAFMGNFSTATGYATFTPIVDLLCYYWSSCYGSHFHKCASM